MDRFWHILKKTYVTIIFIIIECCAVVFFVKHSVYSGTVALNFANQKLGGINSWLHNIDDYFRLSEINDDLARQNAELTHRVLSLESLLTVQQESAKDGADSLLARQKLIEEAIVRNESSNGSYMSVPATVISNSTNNQENYITLNKGSVDGVERLMSVVSGNAVVGYIIKVSKNYSIALSAISREFKASAMLQKDRNLCLVYWDGMDSGQLVFTEMSKYAPVNVGDTVVTTGFSTLFPPNLEIGTISGIEDGDRTFIGGTIKPAVDFTRLKYVTIIEHSFVKERRELEGEIQ